MVDLKQYLGLGWGVAKTVSQHPYLLQHGAWPLSKVRFRHLSDVPYQYHGGDETAYQQYRKDNYEEKQFYSDRTKLMLKTVPVDLIDTHTLSLVTREVKYSQIQYTVDVLSQDENRKKQFIDSILKQNSIDFAHVLSLFVLVLSNDGNILLAQRSNHVKYHPGTWQISMTEQFEKKDLFHGYYDPEQDEYIIQTHKPIYSNEVVASFFKRALLEELNLKASEQDSNGDYNINDARIFSLFLEADVLNMGICSFVKVDMDSDTLLARVREHANVHRELIDFDLLPVADIEGELISPSRQYHPSNPYMLYMYLLYLQGETARNRLNSIAKS